MALEQLPDFSYKGEVPFASIVSAYQQKVQQEEQMKMNQEALKQQKINNVKDIFTQGAGLVSTLTEHNKQKQMKEAQNALVNLLGQGSDKITTPQMVPAQSSMVPQLQEAKIGDTVQDYSKTPEYKSQLASLVTKAFPEDAGKEVAKAAFGSLYGPKQGVLSGRDIQQKNIMLPSGERVSLQLLETTPSQKYGTQFTWTDLGGNEIDPAMLEGAVEAPTPGSAVDQFGNPIVFEKVGPGGSRRVGTGTPSETAASTQESDPENAFLRLQNKAPKLGEEFKKSLDSTTTNNPVIQSKVESINAARYANSILSDPKADETELRSVYTYIARAVEKGALTEADKEAFSEPLSIMARGENSFYKHLTGSAGPKFKNSLKRLQIRLEHRGNAELINKITTEKMKAKRLLGRAWEPGLDKMYPTPKELVIEMEQLNPDYDPADEQALDDILKELQK